MYAAVRQTTVLASPGAVAWAVIFGIIVLVVLIAAFWWGERRAARRRLPPKSPQPGADSWHSPDPAETRHSARAHGDDHPEQ